MYPGMSHHPHRLPEQHQNINNKKQGATDMITPCIININQYFVLFFIQF